MFSYMVPIYEIYSKAPIIDLNELFKMNISDIRDKYRYKEKNIDDDEFKLFKRMFYENNLNRYANIIVKKCDIFEFKNKLFLWNIISDYGKLIITLPMQSMFNIIQLKYNDETYILKTFIFHIICLLGIDDLFKDYIGCNSDTNIFYTPCLYNIKTNKYQPFISLYKNIINDSNNNNNIKINELKYKYKDIISIMENVRTVKAKIYNICKYYPKSNIITIINDIIIFLIINDRSKISKKIFIPKCIIYNHIIPYLI